MTSFNFTTAEDLESTRFGSYLLDIVVRLKLPLPNIKGSVLKKFHKEGCWGIKATQQGRDNESIIEAKIVSDSKEKGLNLIIQELVGRLCGRYSNELKGHYSILFGRRDEKGTPFVYDAKDRGKAEHVCQYLQDMEYLVEELRNDRYSELLKNDELCALLKEKEEKFKKQEEMIQAQEEKLQAQEKKFKSQEKRIQAKNKEMKELKMELESNEVEFEADIDLIKLLRAEKRELQEKNSTLEKELKELKVVLDDEGIVIEMVDEDDDTMVE